MLRQKGYEYEPQTLPGVPNVLAGWVSKTVKEKTMEEITLERLKNEIEALKRTLSDFERTMQRNLEDAKISFQRSFNDALMRNAPVR